MWECPSSSISQRIWQAIDLFWRCYQRRPGFSGWEIHRVDLPRHGGIEDQDNWAIWAFSVLETEFYHIEAEARPQNVESHEQIKAKHGLK